MGLQELLDKHGFGTTNPFETFTSEAEAYLPEWFVPPAFLTSLIGTATGPGSTKPPTPISHVVYGRPGDGKTALRLHLERALAQKDPNALVIRYIDFAGPFGESPSPTLDQHIEELLRLGTMGLIARWFESPGIFSRLPSTAKSDLAWLVQTYWETLPPPVKEQYTRLTVLGPLGKEKLKAGLRAAVDAYNGLISILKIEKVSPTAWPTQTAQTRAVANPFLRLQRLWSVASLLGCSGVWVLVDKVDETPGVQTPEAIFRCISNILLSQALLEFAEDGVPALCFKVFLTRPDELKAQLKQAGFRTDRVKVDTIRWLRKDLDTAFTRRLGHFSNKQTLHFDEVCSPTLKKGTHDRLLDECGLRPRTLFRMCAEILAEFAITAQAAETSLDQQSIETGIKRGKDAEFG